MIQDKRLPDKYQVMTSSYSAPSSWKWKHRRSNVAVVEVNLLELIKRGLKAPIQINDKHKTINKIIRIRKGLYVGLKESAFSKELERATELAKGLNENAEQMENRGLTEEEMVEILTLLLK